MESQSIEEQQPQKKGGCLKTCLIGCGTVFLVIFLIIAAITIWFLLPYDTYKIEDFFSDNHVGAVELTLDPSNEGIFTMVKNAIMEATKEANKDKSESELKEALAQVNEGTEKLKSISSLSCQFLISSDGESEDILFMAPMPSSISKLMQSLYSLTTLAISSEAAPKIGGATVVLLEDHNKPITTPRSKQYGITCVKGYGMIGNVDPLIKEAAQVVTSGKPAGASATSYVVSNWPKDSKSLVKVVLDNKQKSVDRLIKFIVVEIEVMARKTAIEAQGQTPDEKQIREDVLKNYQPTSLDSDFFNGITIEADIASLNDIRLPLRLELKDPAGMGGLQGWIQQVAQRVSSLSPVTIEVGNMSQDGNHLIVPLQIKGFGALMDQLEEARKLTDQANGLEVGSVTGVESDCGTSSDSCGAAAGPACGSTSG